MKLMCRRSLVSEWQELSGICTQETLKQLAELRKDAISAVPWLLHDPIAWLLNFVLVLPIDVDIGEDFDDKN